MGPSSDRDRLTFRASLLSTHQSVHAHVLSCGYNCTPCARHTARGNSVRGLSFTTNIALPAISRVPPMRNFKKKRKKKKKKWERVDTFDE